MNIKNSLVSALVAVSFLLSGCAAFVAGGAAAGAGIVWYKGRLTDTVSKPLPVVRTAVIAGLKDLRIEVVQDKGDSLTATVKAKLGDGKDVRIYLRSLSENTTKLVIRVGMFGDEEFSRRILESIRHYY